MRRDPILQIEPTDHCDLRCGMCGPHRDASNDPHAIPRGFLQPARIEGILKRLCEENRRFDHVILQWMGEPLLHPSFPEILGLTARAMVGRAGYLRIDTNALALDPGLSRRILDAWTPSRGLPLLFVFSLDARRASTWLKVKRHASGDSALFHRVLGNIRALVDLRAGMRGAPLRFQVQLVVQESNAREAAEFVEYWTAFFRCRARAGHPSGDEILLKRLSVGTGGPEQAAADSLYDRTLREQGLQAREAESGAPALRLWERGPWEPARSMRPPCPALWLTPVIRHDGHLTTCCADLRGELDLGSLEDATFAELWDGPEMNRRRLAHLEGHFKEVPLCAACGGFTWYELSLQEILHERSRLQGLLPPFERR